MTEHDAASDESAEWKAALTTGHGWPRGIRAVFMRIPRAPRCKICATPFAGPGGRVAAIAGFKPSRKNPLICARCLDSMPPGGATVDVAVLFADVRGSTGLAESLGSARYAALLNRFYATATKVLIEHDAVIDKLIGDEVMALFVRGIAGPEYRRRACEAALALLRAVQGKGEPSLPVGVAVHAGEAFVGNVGGTGVTDFTALGDTVNIAARLQSFASPGELVFSEEVLRSATGLAFEGEAREVDVRGRSEHVAVRVGRP